QSFSVSLCLCGSFSLCSRPPLCRLPPRDSRVRVTRHPLLGASAFLVALTVILTWPQALYLGSRVAAHNDPLLSIWRLAWIAHVLPGNPQQLIDGNIFTPHVRTLAYSDATLL